MITHYNSHRAKQTDPKAFFQEIIGIEKEYRLSKVAKVAAFMYGQEGIEILHHDALDQHHKVQKGSFNILVANPPFAVEGFLETLPEDQRQLYALTQTVSDVANNRNIQCFFIERAGQLLNKGGVAGIIVPSSVLSNSDSTHIGSREILLQYFDIVALVELGNGTFGKTGTNTVVLFIRRKQQLPEPAEHFKNRVEDWFENDSDEAMETYQDLHLIKKYCQHIAIPFEHYQTLLNGTPSADLLAHELFLDYKKDFDQSTDIKKLATQKFFKAYSAEQKQAELDKRYLAYLQKIEKDKLLYFVLAYNNPQKVLIVKSPSDNKEQKQFLGYEWSAAKGNEGLKMTTNALGHHLTPLYDPENRYNPDKLNALIQDNFSGNAVVIPEALETYASLVSLVNLLDFSRKDFDKHISLSVKKNVSIDTQWDLVKLGEIATIESGGTPSSTVSGYWDGDICWATLVDTKEKYLTTTQRKITAEGLKKSSAKLMPVNTVIFSSRATIGDVTIAKVETATNQGYKNFICDAKRIRYEYLYYILKYYAQNIADLASGMTFKEISKTEISAFKIPLPPLEIQAQIVQACEAVDAELIAAQTSIEQAKSNIKPLLTNDKFPLEKLENVAIKANEQIDPNNYDGEVNYIGLENIESQTGRLVGDIRANYNQIKSAKTCFKINDVLYGKLRPNLNKVYLAKEEGICSTDILVFSFENEYLAQYYAHYLLSDEFNKEVLKGVKGQQLPRTSWKHLSFIKVPYPNDLNSQQQLISEIATQETLIANAQQIIDATASKKQAILKHYL